MKVKDIKKGMRFFEQDLGMTVSVEATEDARRVENREGWADGWEVDAVVTGGDGEVGEITSFFASDMAPGYAPDLTLITE